MTKILLQANDGTVFEVDRGVIGLSNTLNTMFKDLGMDDAAESLADPIPLQNVNKEILSKIVEWCQHHKDDQPQDDSEENNRPNHIPQWDEKFLRVDLGMIFEIILAANYLDIPGLLDVACKTIAKMIEGKTVEEIRRTFNIRNDFTPEEEQSLREDTAWVDE